jgi:hypothetical protein
MSQHLEQIKGRIEPLRSQIINHKVYSVIETVEDLTIFMQYHVYAVWDFMSLLKTLQNSITCTTIPWFPKGSGETRSFINEIVLGEESDVDLYGNKKSHFELYLDAMEQCGANTSEIECFLTTLQKTGSFKEAYSASNTPKEAQAFINFTFDIVNSNKDYLQAAVFTFGREDLIPEMFISIVNDMHKTFPDSIAVFKYYLERHIEVDGDHHSHLSLQMTSNLCGENNLYWEEAEQAVCEALQRRIDLWDGAYQQIVKGKSSFVFSN